MKKSDNQNSKKNNSRVFLKKYWVRCLFFGLLAIISSAAFDYINDGVCHFSALFFARVLVLFALYMLLFWGLKSFLSKKDSNLLRKNRIVNYLLGDKTSFYKQVLIIAGVIIALWLPYLIVSYPGNMSNDTTGQIPMFFSMFDDQKDYAMQDQHPVFTTLVFGSMIYLGNSIFNDMHIALAICIFLQMIITALVFSFAIVWARRKWRIGVLLSIFLVGLVTLFPIVPLMVISLSKDTFFSWIYVLLLIALFELVKSDFKIINNKKYLLALVILCLGACLTKKLGVYVVSGTLLLFIVFCGQQLKIRLKMTIPLLVSVVTMFVIMPFMIANTGIIPSPTKEMFALPFQQTALTYIRHKDDMSEDEIKQLDDLLDLSTLEKRYIPNVGDLVKGPVDNNSDFGGYVKLYVKQFLKYPDSYFDAFASQVAGLFVPYTIEPIFDNHWHTWNGDYFDEEFFNKPEFSRVQSERLEEYYNWFADVPVFNLALFSVTYVIFIPIAFIVCIIERKNNRRELLIVVPIIVSIAGLMMSSTVYYGNEAMRYIMPFVYTMPVIIAYLQYILTKKPTKIKDKHHS